MILVETWKSWKNLTPPQRTFLTDPRMEATLPRVEWVDGLRKLISFSLQVKTTQLILRISGGALVPLAIVLAIVFDSGWPLLLWPISGVAFLLAWYVARFDVPGFVDQFILPFLVLLGEETEGESPLSLKLDLRGYLCDDKRVMDPSNPSRPTAYYRDAWFTGNATLADGSRLAWKVSDFLRYRKSYKCKYRMDVEVLLSAKAKDYAVATRIPEDKFRRKVRQGEKRHVVRVRSATKNPQYYMPRSYAELVRTIGAAYQCLIPVDTDPKKS